MKSKSTAFIATLVMVIATTATVFGGPMQVPPPFRDLVIPHGSVSLNENTNSATGVGYVVTRQGLGLYTIIYTRPFSKVPKLVIDPALRGFELVGITDPAYITNRVTGCVAAGYSVMAQSPGSVTILYTAGPDPTSQLCIDHTDVFGNTITICHFTRLLYGEVPFTFAAFE